MEGMFIISIILWNAHTNIGSYADLDNIIMPHYRNGATEVHVLFDNPKCNYLKFKHYSLTKLIQYPIHTIVQTSMLIYMTLHSGVNKS